jgi:hypothetical protein
MHEKQLKGRDISYLDCEVKDELLRRTVLRLVEPCLIVRCFTWLISTTAIIETFFTAVVWECVFVHGDARETAQRSRYLALESHGDRQVFVEDGTEVD